jgi:hypothetical protein
LDVLKTKLVIEPQDVHARLAEFGTKRDDIVRIALTALGARNDSVPDDPRTAKGQFSYIYGVRAMRQVFTPAGYERVSKQNIESVYDAANARKIMFQTVDCACLESQIPEAISEIGSGKETVIENSYRTGYLFADMQADEDLDQKRLTEYDRAEAWYICAAFVNGTVACELSRPQGVVDKQFAAFIERIFILREGEGGPSGLINLKDDVPRIEIKPVVVKR